MAPVAGLGLFVAIHSEENNGFLGNSRRIAFNSELLSLTLPQLLLTVSLTLSHWVHVLIAVLKAEPAATTEIVRSRPLAFSDSILGYAEHMPINRDITWAMHFVVRFFGNSTGWRSKVWW